MTEGPSDRETEMVVLRKDMENHKTELEGKIEVVRTEISSLTAVFAKVDPLSQKR